ncbi:MAG: outer membrane beta-barrel protein [Bacteroidetes bacterium]|nr:outer membrane beta-barrel protein [Bacteroidota bacterium]
MKRKYTLIILLVVFAAAGAQAQMKSYIDIYGGASYAEGNFAASDYSNNNAGFGKRGATFGLDGAYYFSKKLPVAIGASIIFQDQGEVSYTDAFNLATGYTASYKADYTTVTTVGRYHAINFLAGPQYSFQYHKFILDLRAAAGVSRVSQTPAYTIAISGVPEQSKTIYQREGGGLLPIYGGSAGLRFKFADNWSVGLRGAYYDTSTGLKVNTDGLQEPAQGRLVTRLPSFSVFQTTLGITLDL